MQRLAALLAAALLAGCATPFLGGAPGVSGWESVVEASMAPDFSGAGETYPVLLVHQHHVPSERQKEAWAGVVCLDAESDAPLVPLPPATADEAASAPCFGPPADAATGRVYLPRAEFERTRPDALVLLMDGCAGGALVLDAARTELVVRSPSHDFLVALHANRTFSVDGAWVEPGTALKVSYFVNRGDAKDEEFVRVVFDAPGEWRRDRVAERDAALDGDVPPRPWEGTGLVVDAPLSPDSLAAPLRATLAATPGTVTGVEALRMVHDGERLTEVTLRYATDRGSVTWYGAGRTGDALRLLGAHEPSGGGEGAPVDTLLARFDLPWGDLRGGLPGMTDVRLNATLAWATLEQHRVALDPLPAPVLACGDGCVRVHDADPLRGEAWRVLLAPRPVEARGALTLHVVAHEGEDAASLWWHAPQA